MEESTAEVAEHDASPPADSVPAGSDHLQELDRDSSPSSPGDHPHTEQADPGSLENFIVEYHENVEVLEEHTYLNQEHQGQDLENEEGEKEENKEEQRDLEQEHEAQEGEEKEHQQLQQEQDLTLPKSQAPEEPPPYSDEENRPDYSVSQPAYPTPPDSPAFPDIPAITVQDDLADQSEYQVLPDPLMFSDQADTFDNLTSPDHPGLQEPLASPDPPALPLTTSLHSAKGEEFARTAKGKHVVPAGEVMAKEESGILQKPVVTHFRTRCITANNALSINTRARSSSMLVREERRQLGRYKRAGQGGWNPNPAVTVPMKAGHWGVRARHCGAGVTRVEEDWHRKEEKDKAWRDHQMALELGYETLIGNIQYIDIPGGRDLNRSWQNFLSQDPMDWGFPYLKGSQDRPRLPQPSVYLAHQLKEKLWKYPRSRLYRSTQED